MQGRAAFHNHGGTDASRTRRVLVVEDDDGLRNLIEKTLCKAGYDAEGAPNCARALAHIEANPDMVLLLDQNLPDASGIDLLRALIGRGIKVPFVVMTGQGDERLAVEMMKLGAADYLVKDLDILEFLPRVFKRLFEKLDTEKRLLAVEHELKVAEDELKKRESLLNKIFEVIPIGLWFADRNGRLLRGNPAGVRIWGAEPTVSIGEYGVFKARRLPSGQEIAPEDWALAHTITKGLTVKDELLEIDAFDGHKRTILNYSAPVMDDEGELLGAIVVNNDITDLRRLEEDRRILEERLSRSEKMEALGTLAGGVAHDLNNVLGIVVGYAEMLLGDMDETDPMRSDLLNIQQGGERAAAIVQDLLTLARRGVQTRKAVNLNTLVMECCKTPEFERLVSFHSRIRMELDLESDLLNILGSPVHLGKTVLNLVSNAVEAMPDGGVFRIVTSNRYLDRPIQGYDAIREGDYVVLTVSDTGEGISSVDLKRIFEPFYTKKVMGRSGTGLGLAVVWGTVKDHHGYIDVESEEGKGSVFTMYFPVTREDVLADRLPVSLSEYMGSGETVLVVDDVRGQRDLAVRMLGRLGYNVTSVGSGEAAVDYIGSHRVDLVVLDMIMDPGMDGLETYRRILEIRPGQKAIIVSGFAETERVKEAHDLGAGAYVRKPYLLERLGLAVRRELERRPDIL